MARPESQAIGGYFAFPAAHLDAVAALIDARAALAKGEEIAVIDPCAADGAAVLGLIDRILPPGVQENRDHRKARVALYACEMEATRAKALASAVNRRHGWQAEQRIVHGDMFRLEVSRSRSYGDTSGAALMWLNPPYDPDREYGRLEQRFLVRATPWLGVGGVLAFIVPHYALSASATLLAQHYEALRCYRLPDPDFDVFRQVVLLARRRAYPLAGDLAEHPVAQQVRQWAADAASVPALPFVGMATPMALPALDKGGFARWALAPVDLVSVREQARPWVAGAAGKAAPMGAAGVDRGLGDLIGRVHPVAMPLKPGHIAQALASGMLNGKRVTPDDPGSGLPALLIKGVFEREYKTVEERTNRKTGEVRGYVQVQQPRLRVSVLDLDAYAYHDLAPGTEATGAATVGEMTIADVLARYGLSLGRVLAQQCPPLHRSGDPAHRMALPPVARAPFAAQAEVAQAALKLIGQGVNPFILGEVGTGKSLMSQVVASALSPRHIDQTRAELRRLGLPTAGLRPVRNVLIMCPPHLLTSWRNEVAATLPGAQVVVLESPSQVRAPQGLVNQDPDLPGAGMAFYVLSRETAKLGHGLTPGVDGQRRCPRCGASARATDKALVEERQTCGATRLAPADEIAAAAAELAALLATAFPAHWQTRSLVPAGVRRQADRRAERRAALDPADRPADVALAWAARAYGGDDGDLGASPLHRVVAALLGRLTGLLGQDDGRDAAKGLLSALTLLLYAVRHPGRDALIALVAEAAYQASVRDPKAYGWGNEVRGLVRALILSMGGAGGAAQAELAAKLRALPVEAGGYGSSGWGDYDTTLGRLVREIAAGKPISTGSDYSKTFTVNDQGQRIWRQGYDAVFAAGDPACAVRALELLIGLGAFERSAPCPERLYQAAPTPRRYPLATYIARHARHLFDLFLLDEGHEYNNDGTAQERAAHRIVELGVPTVVLSGSVLNGYVSSMYSNMWALSRRFRATFGRDGKGAFVTRYGYRKRLVELPEDDKAEARSRRFGSVSDRVDDGGQLALTRSLGEAPGVLPLFLLEWVLPMACPIHKDDLDQELPPYQETPVLLPGAGPVGTELRKRYAALQRAIVERIGKDRWEPGLAGKLFGALGQAATYPDRCTADTGNTGPAAARAWVSAYPESAGGAGVATAELFPAGTILPKETWTLRRIGAELAEGRNVLVFVTNTGADSGLVRRLHRLITEAHGDVAAILDAAKVDTKRRQAWIDSDVIGKGKRVLLVNPMAIKTGLNNLVPWFSTGIWFQLPNADAITYRQANGRLHRIGQTNEVRVFVPVYKGTAQELAMGLLGRKVAASTAVDGLDIVSALDAAGAGEGDSINVMDLGRHIYEMAMAEAAGERWAA